MVKGHAFNLGDRLLVPRLENVQGLVTLPSGANDMAIERIISIDAHTYFMRWLADDGEKQCGWFSSMDVALANPEPVGIVRPAKFSLAGAAAAPKRKAKRKRK